MVSWDSREQEEGGGVVILRVYILKDELVWEQGYDANWNFCQIRATLYTRFKSILAATCSLVCSLSLRKSAIVARLHSRCIS